MDELALFLFKTSPNSSQGCFYSYPIHWHHFPSNQPRNIQNSSHPAPPKRAIPPFGSLHCKAEGDVCSSTEKPVVLTLTQVSAAATHRTPRNGTVLRHAFPQIHSTPQQLYSVTNMTMPPGSLSHWLLAGLLLSLSLMTSKYPNATPLPSLVS